LHRILVEAAPGVHPAKTSSLGTTGRSAKLLTKDEARRIAANIAKLRELLRESWAPKTCEYDKEDGERERDSVHNPTMGVTNASRHAYAVRSCRADRDICALCSVPSRRLSVARRTISKAPLVHHPLTRTEFDLNQTEHRNRVRKII
jgi:hypothetical protein